MIKDENGKLHSIARGLNLEGFIEKSDLSYAFPSYGDDKMTFERTGKEIKEKLSAKKSKYEAKKIATESKMDSICATLKEAGYEPKNESSRFLDEDKVYLTFSYKQMEDKEMNTGTGTDDYKQMMRQYNDLVYKHQDLCEELKVIDVLMENVKDDSKYTFNIRQIMALEKSEEEGDIKKAGNNKPESRPLEDTDMPPGVKSVEFLDEEKVLEKNVVTDMNGKKRELWVESSHDQVKRHQKKIIKS